MLWEPELGRAGLLFAEDNFFKKIVAFWRKDLPCRMRKGKHCCVPRQLSGTGRNPSWLSSWSPEPVGSELYEIMTPRVSPGMTGQETSNAAAKISQASSTAPRFCL